METKFEEENTRLLSKRSNNEDISIYVEEEMELIEDHQGRRVKQSGAKDINTSSPTSDEKDAIIIASMSKNNQLVNFMKGMLDEIHPSLSSELCIYRIPQKMRQVNEKAYDPRVISIGPFHHGGERFKSMEAFKKRYFQKVVQRNSTTVGLEKYVEFLKDQEKSVRQCYSEIIEMNSNEFVTMLLLDGCFIIELFLCSYYSDLRDVEYYQITARRFENDIYRDLSLLENQIPFFVLEGLFHLAMTDFMPVPLLDLAISFFTYYNAQKKSPNDINSIIKHFTDLLLIFHRPMSLRTAAKEFQSTKTATELDEAGVKFKMSSSSTCLLDIEFSSNGVLKIPRIVLEDDTEFLIRNLMALEVCHYPDNSYIIDYFLFMDDLVNTPKDVDLLVQGGIIDNCLGDSKQAADLINNMNTNITITPNNNYFSNLREELNTYCKIPRHRWRAALKRDYFSTPWRGASTIAAVLFLFLTLVQTVCSVLSAVNGN